MVTAGDFVSIDLNFPNDLSRASDKAKTVKIKLGVLKLLFVQTYGLYCSLREPLRDTPPVKNAMYESPYCVLFVKRHLSEKYQTWLVVCLCFASRWYFLSKSRADIGKGCTPPPPSGALVVGIVSSYFSYPCIPPLPALYFLFKSIIHHQDGWRDDLHAYWVDK